LTSQLANCYNGRKQTAAGACATIIFRLKFQTGFPLDRLRPTEHSIECHYAAASFSVFGGFFFDRAA